MNAHTTISPLDDRIADALAGTTSSDTLAALTAEACEASERAANSYSAARMRALDPATPRARVTEARQAMADAEFDAERLKAALLALEAAHARALEREARARDKATYDEVKAERDVLADDLRRECPALITRLVDLLSRIEANDRRVKSVGERGGPRLDSAEVVARGGREAFARGTPQGLSTTIIPKLTDAKLPSFTPSHPGWMWPEKNGL
jgi:hypothetical protein